MNVLSLFDGISCGQVALNRAGIKDYIYYASEIDETAIKITQHHFPNTIQLGNVINLKGRELPQIDLLLGGSPCQDLSGANRNGKGLKGERSSLFFDFCRIKGEVKPTWFLFENVKMKKEDMKVITNLLGVNPIEINSNLVSAQNRKRFYWTNIPFDLKIKDLGILLSDIVFDNNWKHFSDERIERTKIRTKNYVKWDLSGKRYYSQQDRAYFLDNKSCTVPKSNTEGILNICLDFEKGLYRKMHPIEVERLQTLPDNYTDGFGLSDAKRKGYCGDGWTVDVIVHILKGISI